MKKRVYSIAILFFLCMCFSITLSAENFTLKVSPNAEENCVQLKWTPPGDKENYSYRIFQNNSLTKEFYSIPSKGTVKVLNVYPNAGVANTGLSGGQRDLDGRSVPNSGILKTWLLKEQIDDVVIETVSLDSFNANPGKYLYKENGLWNYDSVFYGMWNLWPMDVYPNDRAIEHLRTFIHEGGGFMTSHHTIGYTGLDRGVNKLADEMGVEIFSNQTYRNAPAYAGRDASGRLYDTVSFELIENVRADFSSYWPYGSRIEIAQTGALTKYPFYVGEVGTQYDIPIQHGMNILGKGQVWMKTVNPTGFVLPNFKEINKSPKTGEAGTNNFYLHTYNNTAIINSGHSFPQITQAETRIIANTLYYLSQITVENSWDDHTGIDITAPETPVLHDLKPDTKNQTLTLSMSSKEKGTTYQYYIEANNLATNTKIKSNTQEAFMESGFAGYSIEVDQKPDTVPDCTVESQSDVYTLSLSGDYVLSEPVYVHIRAVDKAGNGSETTHDSFTYSEPLLDYDGQLDFLMDEYSKVELKIAVGSTNMNLANFKTNFYAELAKRGVNKDTFSIEFINYSNNQQFMNLLEPTAWEEGSLRFLIHMSDKVAFFGDTALRSQVLAKTKQEQIHYIGLGGTSVQVNTLKFVIDNEDRGYYVYSGNSSRATLILVDYLIWKITFPEGMGTADNPFIIRRGDQFYGMKYMMNGYYKLVQNVDMHGITFRGVGDANHPFTGHIDGLGYSIGNFSMHGEEGTPWDYVGLFRFAWNAEIQNIVINDVTVTGGKYVGGLIGYAYGSETTIAHCEIGEAVIQGGTYVGGLIGYLDSGTVETCSSYASVYGNEEIGGVIGHAFGSKIRDIFTAATVTGNQNIGGMIGYSDRNYILNCDSVASVVGNKNAGGLLGFHNGTKTDELIFDPVVQDCDSMATVKAIDCIGGIVGCCEAGNLTQCTSYSTLEGEEHVGELVGVNHTTVS